MTKSQRAQVVELLRCAVDVRSLGAAKTAGEFSDKTWTLACKARTAVSVEFGPGVLPYHLQCLEAAARVEEKSWP